MAERKMPKNTADKVSPTYIGGQAVMEGVMMRGKQGYTIAVRHAEKGIVTIDRANSTKMDRYKLLKWPLIRGVVSFLQSMVVGYKIISDSAEMAGLDDLKEENPSKFDKWLEKTFGDKLMEYVMMFSLVIALGLGIALFWALPSFLSSLLAKPLGNSHILLSVLDGVIRMLIFLVYIVLISRMKEVNRLFGYHGAEHKSIACLERGEELTVENARKHSRLHKRCGTSFLLLVMLVSMIVFFFVPIKHTGLRILSRVLLVPVIAGLSYEVLRWAGRHDNWFVTAVSWPGLMLQKLTTTEPDDAQIEVALAALKGVLVKEDEKYMEMAAAEKEALEEAEAAKVAEEAMAVEEADAATHVEDVDSE